MCVCVHVYVYMCMCTSLLPGHVLCDICLNKLSALMRISPLCYKSPTLTILITIQRFLY